MALEAIDAIRNAEQSAQSAIISTQEEAERDILQAHTKAKEIVAHAEDAVRIKVEDSVEKTHKEAEALIAESRKIATSDAFALKQKCEKKQDVVNSKIIELII